MLQAKSEAKKRGHHIYGEENIHTMQYINTLLRLPVHHFGPHMHQWEVTDVSVGGSLVLNSVSLALAPSCGRKQDQICLKRWREADHKAQRQMFNIFNVFCLECLLNGGVFGCNNPAFCLCSAMNSEQQTDTPPPYVLPGKPKHTRLTHTIIFNKLA